MGFQPRFKNGQSVGISDNWREMISEKGGKMCECSAPNCYFISFSDNKLSSTLGVQ